MSTSPTPAVQQVGILVLDNDAQGGSAVKQILDSEGWRVRVVGDTKMLLADGGRVRVLFLIPELASGQYIVHLEAARLPYVLRPYHLHDFLEKVSDLLVEVKAIEGPIRQVRHEFGALRKKKKQAAKSNSMFASRDSFSYTDEELAEYEKQEGELSKSKRKPSINLGDPNR